MDNALISVKLENGVIINEITFKFNVSIHTHQATRLQFPLKLAWGMRIYQSKFQFELEFSLIFGIKHRLATYMYTLIITLSCKNVTKLAQKFCHTILLSYSNAQV